MMDSMASTNSKFLPFKSKSVQKFVMPAIVLNDSLSSPIEQVKYFLINLSFRKGERTEPPPPFFFFYFSLTALVHAL